MNSIHKSISWCVSAGHQIGLRKTLRTSASLRQTVANPSKESTAMNQSQSFGPSDGAVIAADDGMIEAPDGPPNQVAVLPHEFDAIHRGRERTCGSADHPVEFSCIAFAEVIRFAPSCLPRFIQD
jgi:hypothetical protein